MPTATLPKRRNRMTVLRRLHLSGLTCAITGTIALSGTTAFPQELLYKPVEIRAVSNHEAYLRYFYEHYSYFDDDTHGVAATYVYRDLNKWTLFAEPIFQRKFGFDEGFLSFGGAYKFDSQTTLMETIGFPLGNNGTFPDFLTDTEVVHPVKRWLAMHLGYKLSIFEDADVHALYAGTTIYSRDDLYLHLKLFEVITDFSGPAGTDATTSVLVKVGGFPNAANEVALFYGRNSYSFVSAEDVGNLDSNTFGMLWNCDLTKNWGIVSSMAYEDREKPSSGNQFRLDIGFRFKL